MHASLDNLLRKLARLPGLGPRSARRAVLYLLKNRDRLMLPLAQDLFDVASQVRSCAECGNLDHGDKCSICRDTQRDHSCVCVVEDVGDLWAMERAAVYRGVYHILGGTLNALDGLKANEKKIKENLDKSLMLVTALAPKIGYEKAAEIAKKALKENISLKQSAKALGHLSEQEFDKIVKPELMVAPKKA